MNWGLQNGTKIHKVKARKNLTVMLISDPTKNGVTLRIPKWLRFPLLILPVALLLGVLYTYGYIADLESQLAAERSDVQSSAHTILDKDLTIEALIETDTKRVEQLKGLAILSVQLKARLSELEAYKAVIDEKLGSTDKTTDTQPTRSVSNQSSDESSTLLGREPVINELTITSGYELSFVEATEDIHVMTDEFSEEVDRLLEELGSTSTELNDEKEDYEVIESEVNKILPYWKAYPSVLPIEATYVTSPYGYRRNPFGTGYEFHKGVDFKAYYQDVWATGSGVVIYSGYNSGYGYMVIIDHGYGIVSKYAHNSKLLVKVGTVVERYTVIAKSGNSGRSSGPHLHYEILENGENQNPLNYIYQGE